MWISPSLNTASLTQGSHCPLVSCMASPLPAGLSSLMARPHQAAPGPAAAPLSSRQQPVVLREFQRGLRRRRSGGMAAALTLLTEISISVMGVGTCRRRRVSERAGLGPAVSLLQPPPALTWEPPTSQPGSVNSLATKARQSFPDIGLLERSPHPGWPPRRRPSGKHKAPVSPPTALFSRNEAAVPHHPSHVRVPVVPQRQVMPCLAHRSP